MKSLDEILAEKLIGLAHFVLSKLVKPDFTFQNVQEINDEMIETIKKKYGIEGIIIDVDETLRKEMKSIPNANKEWL